MTDLKLVLNTPAEEPRPGSRADRMSRPRAVDVLTTVAERLKPERLYERFLAYRESLGMEIIPATGGRRPPLDVLLERVQEGRIVPLLADRDLSRRGIDVEFFGARTRMPPGPAVLALRTGAPLYVVAMWYEGPLVRGRRSSSRLSCCG